MSLQTLFDATLRVYRPTETKDQYRTVERTWVQVGSDPSVPNGTISPPELRLTDLGAGERPAGSTEAYMEPDADVEIGDVLDVIGGPETGRRYRVVSLARPRGHHTEMLVEIWGGVIP